MSQTDNIKKISCPKCGTVGAIYVLKVSGREVVIKQRCPIHGEKAYKIPFDQVEQYLPYFNDAVFRCFKCGQTATIYSTQVKGPWTLLRSACPKHGSSLPVQKIWTSIYNQLSPEHNIKATPTGSVKIEPVRSETKPLEEMTISSEGKKFCPHCGAQLEEAGKFCGSCGAEIDK
jgi:hypothetical protein